MEFLSQVTFQTHKKIVYHLSILEKYVQRPIYYTAGNHDYYGGSIESVRKQLKELSGISPYIKYLSEMQYVSLTKNTGLVGHDGWYDVMNGNIESRFLMYDWAYIHDFIPHSGGPKFIGNGNLLNRGSIIALARKLAHESVIHVQLGIKAALRQHKNIIILTHIPPFVEAHQFQGKKGDDNASPYYTSKLMGLMLKDVAAANPNVKFSVYCGHTHGKWSGNILPNLVCNVGESEYNVPMIQRVVDVL